MPRARREQDGQAVSAVSKEESDLAIKALLKASTSPRSLLNLFGGAQSNTSAPIVLEKGMNMRKQRQTLTQSISSMTPSQAKTFFGTLQDLVQDTIETQQHVPESAFDNDDGDDADREIVPDPRSSEALQFLYYATLCVHSYGHHQVVFETAVLLHNIVEELEASCGPDALKTVQAIVNLCASWWTNNGIHKEQIILQVLPILVQDALLDSMKMKRLCSMRSALQVIDLDDPESREFRNLLLRVASSPATVKTAEGKKFLSYLLTLEGSILEKLHASIRAQIPEATKTVHAAFGEIYYRAWKESKCRECIEQHVLQDLTYAVIHLANPSSVIVVLEAFHVNKNHEATGDLLYRMYGPTLWRSLAAANAKVRVNAAKILSEVFPLMGPGKPSDHVERACSALKALLQDSDPRVRLAGSEAVAQVLTTYWDVVDSRSIRSLLNHLVAEHASDATTSAVRMGAINAVTQLLEAPQSHAVLREILPSLGNLIHDRVERVRLAVVRMLVAVKKAKTIKFFHVVHQDHLLARLAEEGKHKPTNSVASALTGLLCNSFFPNGPNVSALEQVKRSVTFMKKDPEAAEVFYANLAGHVDVDFICTLTVKLLRCLHNTIKTEQKLEMKRSRVAKEKRRRVTAAQGEDDEEEHEAAENSVGLLAAADTVVLARLAETICILWQSIEKDLECDEACARFLIDEFSGSTLTNALNFFEEKASKAEDLADDEKGVARMREDCNRTTSALLRCAGRLPSKGVVGLVPHISSVLASVEDTEFGPPENVTSHIALLCLWNMTDEVASSLASSIRSAFQDDDLFGSPSCADTKKRRSRRSPQSDDVILNVPLLPARAALAVLGDILRGGDPSSVAARGAIFDSPQASSTIQKALEEGTKRAERVLSGTSSLTDSNAEYVLRVCDMFGRFALHKEASENGSVSFGEHVGMLLHWTTSHVVPALSRTSTGGPDVPFDPNVSSIIVEKSFDVFPLSPEPVSRSRRRVNRNRTPERLDDGIGQLDDSPSDAEASRSASRVSRAFAISLMKSSCTIFSEWLAVGGAAGPIAHGAVEWSRVFDAKQNSPTTLEDLLPAFCRLSMELVKSAGDCSLLKQLLTKCDSTAGGLEDATFLRRALSSLLSTRGIQTEAMVASVVGCALEAAYELLDKSTDEIEYELPATLDALWTGVGSVGSALVAVMDHRSASLELGKRLVELFPVHAEEDSPRKAFFDAKCLWILCDPGVSGSNAAAKVAEMVQKLDADGLQERLGGVIEALLEGVRV